MRIRNGNVCSLKEIRRKTTERVKTYRSNVNLEKKIALRKKDAERKRLQRANTVLTELEKNKIRNGNNRRKQRQRERENNMKRKIDEEKEEASGSSSSSGSKKVVSNDLYEKWRGKYYRDTKLLKVKVSDLTRKNFSQNIAEPSESVSDGSSEGSSSDSDEENPVSSTKCRNNSLSKSIWHVLSPKTKRKTKLSLSMNSDPGLNIQLRKELGINLSNEVHNNEVPQFEFACRDIFASRAYYKVVP